MRGLHRREGPGLGLSLHPSPSLTVEGGCPHPGPRFPLSWDLGSV